MGIFLGHEVHVDTPCVWEGSGSRVAGWLLPACSSTFALVNDAQHACTRESMGCACVSASGPCSYEEKEVALFYGSMLRDCLRHQEAAR